MGIEIDETMQVYIDESLEHLADIEADLLAIEEAGADIDEDVVNKVYRAAHSIKGGAGFFGLTSIQTLTHEMENILGRVRSRELVPNPEIINILLEAADTLNALIADVIDSNNVDVSGHISALAAINEGAALQAQPADHADAETPGTDSQAGTAAPAPDPGAAALAAYLQKTAVFDVDDEVIREQQDQGKHLYLVTMDLIGDLQSMDKELAVFLEDLESTGAVVARRVDTDAVGLPGDSAIPESLPFEFIFATILQPADVNMLLDLDEQQIFHITPDLGLLSLATGHPPELDPVDTASEIPADPVSPPSPVTPFSELSLEEADAAAAAAPSENTAPPSPAPQKAAPVKKPAAGGADTSLRINVSLLDSLMNLAGELVLGRNQLLQALSSADQRLSSLAGQRIDLITSELQEAIMLTRMQPIGIVFNKYPRVVRDLSRQLAKNIELDVEGKTVELDKTIIEAINDPLTHLVRNAVDHGIETPDARRAAGKPETGRVALKAYHAAGQVNIEISDDGKGLDGDKLAAAALSKGLITEEQVLAMSAREKVNLIFLPGFSTAEKVSDVSGRGVGMDVVKTNLDKLGGHTDIDSTPGVGSTIRIKLPLTLAIIPSQIVIAEDERYAIPQVNLVELLRVPADKAKERIEKVGEAEVIRLRGNLLPLVRLADLFGVQRTYCGLEGGPQDDRRENIADRRSQASPLTNNSPEEPRTQSPADVDFTRQPGDRRYRADSALNVAVVSAGVFKYGLIVDRLLDSEEIVVKPLGRHLKQCQGYAGATIMGDGRVSLILDVGNLAAMAGLTSVEGSDRALEVAAAVSGKSADGEKQALLLFRGDPDEHFAVPLAQVERIEKIRAADIETMGGRRVMQYRGGSLPLFAVDEVARVKPLPEETDLLVLVFILAGREIGLLATGPVDTVQVFAEVDTASLRQPGILGSSIIKGSTTLWVDMFEMLQTLKPEWIDQVKAPPAVEGRATTILYAEDSKFFRAQVASFMEESGYTVITAEDGALAWQALEAHAGEIVLVVTDIEMPNVTGLELAAKIKGDPRFADLPVIALTTLAEEADVARGKALGIDDYQVKLDREKLTESIQRFLN